MNLTIANGITPTGITTRDIPQRCAQRNTAVRWRLSVQLPARSQKIPLDSACRWTLEEHFFPSTDTVLFHSYARDGTLQLPVCQNASHRHACRRRRPTEAAPRSVSHSEARAGDPDASAFRSRLVLRMSWLVSKDQSFIQPAWRGGRARVGQMAGNMPSFPLVDDLFVP